MSQSSPPENHPRERNEMTNEELDHLASLEQQLAQAQAQVASLRDALKPFNLNMGPRLDYLPFEVSVGAIRKAAEAYNSTSCGSDFVPKSEMEKAQAQVAEMRDALLLAKDVTSHGFLPNPKTGLINQTHFNVHDVIDHALSTSCGSGMIPVTELDATIEFVRTVNEWCRCDNPPEIDADEADKILTRLQSLRAKGTK